MTSDNLTQNAMDVHAEIGQWAICVGSYPGLTPDEIALEWPYRGRSMRVSTVGNVRVAGFNVVPDSELGRVHALVLLPSEPSEPLWERLRERFDLPQPNPAYPVSGGI